MSRDDIAKARGIPLDRVLESLGAQRDPKDPVRNWRLGSSRITVTDSRFYDHNAAGAQHRMREGKPGGGGAIDLIQYLENISFKDAVARLGGIPRLAPATARSKEPAGPIAERPPPIETHDRIARVRWYLTERRAIPAEIVSRAIENGQVFGDVRGNVVFRLQDLSGAEIGYEVRGTRDRPYHSVHGQKGLFMLPGERSHTVAFVESAIEALSYSATRSAGLIVSTTGSALHLPAKLIQRLSERGFETVAAFNGDRAGDRLSERLTQSSGVLMRRDRPPPELGKDWNEVLQASRGCSVVAPSPESLERAR